MINQTVGSIAIPSSGGSGANTALSNLGVTAINASLLFNADNAYNIGSGANAVADLFVYDIFAPTASGITTFNGDAFELKSIGGGAALRLYENTNSFFTLVRAGSISGTTFFILPPNNGTNEYLLSTDGAGATSWVAPGANAALSNLASVAINTHLLGAADGTINLGSSGTKFGNVFSKYHELYASDSYVYLDNQNGQSIQMWVIDPANDGYAPFDVNSALEFVGPAAIYNGDSDISIETGEADARFKLWLNGIAIVDPNQNPWPAYYGGTELPGIFLRGGTPEDLTGFGTGIFYDGPYGNALFIGTYEHDSTTGTASIEMRVGRQTGTGTAGDLLIKGGDAPTGTPGGLTIALGNPTGGTPGIGSIYGPNCTFSMSLALTDFTNGPIRLPRSASDPGSPESAWFYYNTGTNKARVYNGTTWDELGGGGGGANTTLSNLTSPVAINQDLAPGTDNAFKLGNPGGPFLWAEGYINYISTNYIDFADSALDVYYGWIEINSGGNYGNSDIYLTGYMEPGNGDNTIGYYLDSPKTLYLVTQDNAGVNTAAVNLGTGHAGGDGFGNNSGNLNLFTGNAGTDTAQTSGDIFIYTGTAVTRGAVNMDGTRVNMQTVMRAYNLASDPGGTSSAGDIYYNTVSNKLKVYNGTTWETVTSV